MRKVTMLIYYTFAVGTTLASRCKDNLLCVPIHNLSMKKGKKIWYFTNERSSDYHLRIKGDYNWDNMIIVLKCTEVYFPIPISYHILVREW